MSDDDSNKSQSTWPQRAYDRAADTFKKVGAETVFIIFGLATLHYTTYLVQFRSNIIPLIDAYAFGDFISTFGIYIFIAVLAARVVLISLRFSLFLAIYIIETCFTGKFAGSLSKAYNAQHGEGYRYHAWGAAFSVFITLYASILIGVICYFLLMSAALFLGMFAINRNQDDSKFLIDILIKTESSLSRSLQFQPLHSEF